MIERLKERRGLVKPLLLPATLYWGCLMLVLTLSDAFSNPFWHWVVLLSPILPGLFFARSVVNAIQKLDEMGRKIILESAVVTFAITLFLSLPLGLLERVENIQINGIYIGCFMGITWLVVKLIISHQYE